MFIIDNIILAIDWLENHPEYGFVNGKGIIFSDEGIYPDLSLRDFSFYPQRGYYQESPANRLISLFENYNVVEYGISRTEQFKERWLKVFDSKVDNVTGELINCGLVVVQGKTHCIEKILFCRQAHTQMSSARIVKTTEPEFMKFSTKINKKVFLINNFFKKGYYVKLLIALAEYLDDDTFIKINDNFIFGRYLKIKKEMIQKY